MPLEYPTFDNLNLSAQAELSRRIPEVDPTIFGSFIQPMLTSGAASAYSVTLLVRDAVQQFFPQTATGSFLDLLAGYEGFERTPASPATEGRHWKVSLTLEVMTHGNTAELA